MHAQDIYSVRPGHLAEAEEELRYWEYEWRKAGAVAVSEAHVQQAHQNASRLQSELGTARAQSHPSLELRYYRIVHLIARTGGDRLGKLAFVGIATAVFCGLSLLLSPLVFPTWGSALCGSLLVTFLGACAATALAMGFWPDEAKLQTHQALQRRWADQQRTVESLRADVGRAWASYDSLRRLWALYDRVEAARRHKRELADLLAGAKYRLIHTDWRSLRGVAFEQFLSDVFQALGYRVQTTKGSGDQGVDLIVTGKGRRIAVQAKGYADSVGNKAVQEVYSGMIFYGCEISVVITNSRFTSGARELAHKVGCHLYEGHHIPDLIAGRFF
jgi:hypothetical protein